jgi:hypothetical protein
VPVVDVLNSRALILSDNRAVPGTPLFLNVRGADSDDITMTGNVLQHVGKAFEQAAEVKQGVVMNEK